MTDPIGIPVQAGGAPAAAPPAPIPAQRALAEPAPAPEVAPAPPPRPAAPAAHKRGLPRWMWAVLVAVLLAVAGYAGWAALSSRTAVTTGAKVVQVQVGTSAESASGLTFTLTPPKPYQPSNALLLDKGDTAYETTLTVVNDSGDVAPAAGIAVAATVGGTAAPQIFDQTFLATQQIAVGQKLDVPFRFRVAAGVSGPLQITISESGVATLVASGTL